MFNNSRIPQINPSFQKSKNKNIESNKDNTDQIILVIVYYQMLTNILRRLYAYTIIYSDMWNLSVGLLLGPCDVARCYSDVSDFYLHIFLHFLCVWFKSKFWILIQLWHSWNITHRKINGWAPNRYVWFHIPLHINEVIGRQTCAENLCGEI